MKKLREIFKKEKPIIGMIHLDYLPGQKEFKSMAVVIQKALEDLDALQKGGVDGIIIENWKDETPGPFVSTSDKDIIKKISAEILKKSMVPVGINVLPNDYRASFSIAQDTGMKFIQIDVLADYVKTDYTYSKQEAFEIKVNLEDFEKYRTDNPDILVFASVHPKHYILLEGKTIEQSAKDAIAAGADIIVVTGAVTGEQPILDNLKKVKNVAANHPVFIGSGLKKENASELLKFSDGAIVGTALKTEDFEKVLQKRVYDLVSVVEELRK